jgi:hypothetical protein
MTLRGETVFYFENAAGNEPGIEARLFDEGAGCRSQRISICI